MRLRAPLQEIVRPLLEYRILLSLGLSTACGIVLNTLYPINQANPLLRLISLERPPIYLGLVRSYDLFLYSTPFLFFSMIFSLMYVHIYRKELGQGAGTLPPCPDPRTRQELSLVLGEVHRQLVQRPSPTPRWLSIPERGLYTGIASFGSIGSGKTMGLILPAMRQLFAYRANDPERRLSGIVLEVKGDLCRQLQRILQGCGREEDYVEISLDGDIRYNPLNNSLDAYAQAFNIASIITSIWGKGKEPFWQQSYTDHTGDDDRHHGMGIVVEYAGRSGKPQWIAPAPFKWNYAKFGNAEAPSQTPDEVFDMTFAKDNAALEGFNRWTINGASYPLDQMMAGPSFHLKEGKRYRLRMRNASDDIHPIHLHRHTFEISRIAGQPTSGVLKDVVMVGGFQEAEIDFTADNPGLTLFHCHQQLHMDYGFMSLFDYAG
jgi:hypothetical protein